MAELPRGTVTFLLTDIEGSTTLWEQDAESMRAALSRHDELFEAAVRDQGGSPIKPRGEGDSRFAVFTGAADAVSAALTIQRVLAAEPWTVPRPLTVRIGVHTGEAQLRDGDYYGAAVNRCARVRGIGHGGQTLLSEATAALVRDSLPNGALLRDLGEHRLKDLTRPERVFQLVSRDLPSEFPPLRSLDVLPNNLPRQLTSFVGREQEMTEVKRLLAATSLLTLVGAGGAGKTRLSLQVAADLLDDYHDGVWLVELAALADPALVPQAIASTLGVPEQASRPTVLTLEEHLRPRALLLILDNCEHLVSACAALAETLLRACPHLRILATSREGLGIGGETTWRIPSLSLPDVQQLSFGTPDLASALPRYEAVRLFIDRALAVAPAFAVTNQNAPAVAQICQRLDGIPLAIELAAVRVKVLAPEQIAARLDDRFRLLTGGSRTALPRQQTLRALVDWSHDLLSGPERILFRRLSVFAGGWLLEAGEGICGDGVEALEVLDLLAQLVDKSLVLAEEHRGEARYGLLETLRQYGTEKLRAAGEEEWLRRRHRDWFVGFVERQTAQLSGPGQAEAFARLEAEHDNLRAALDWCETESGGWEVGARLADELNWFWGLRGYRREARERIERLLTLATGRTEGRARALSAAGWRADRVGEYERAAALFEESIEIWRDLGDKRGAAIALARFGRLEQSRGDYDRAWTLLEESRGLFQEIGAESGLDAPLAVFLAQVAKNRGDYERAIPLFEDCLTLARERGDKHAASSILRSLGELRQMRGDYGRAAAHLEESLILIRDLDDRPCAAMTLDSLAVLATARGEPARAVRLFAAAEIAREVEVHTLPLADRDRLKQAVAAARAQLDPAAIDAAWAEGRAMTLDRATDLALELARQIQAAVSEPAPGPTESIKHGTTT